MVVFSDLHIHNYSKFSTNSSRLRNCLDVLDEIFGAAKNNDTHILFCGDLFDKQITIPVEVYNSTIEKFSILFARYPTTKFYAISGNHDHASKNTLAKPAISALESISIAFKNFVIIDNLTAIIENYRVFGIPYYEYIEDFYSVLAEIPNNIDILVIHQAPIGISNKFIHANLDIDFAKKFKMTLCGHIHKRETLKNNLYIIGSPMHKDLSDEGEIKGYYLLNDYEMTFVPLDKYPKFSSIPSEGNYYVPRLEKILEKELNIAIETVDISKHNLLKAFLKQEKRMDLFELATECL